MEIIKVKSRNYTRIKTDKLLLVIHWAACTGAQCVSWFQSPGCRTSAHYVIDRFGNITQMVDEKYIAWHAGYSRLKTYPTTLRGQDWQSLNVCSIGIELGGPPAWVGWPGWPQLEIDTLIELCKDIKTRWPDIRLTDHSTIAPQRKYDVKKGTGIDLFPWERLLTETGIEEA